MTDSASELLALARQTIDEAGSSTAHLWPRACALLARQALEASFDELWAARAPGLASLSARAQLSVLPDYLRDPGLAGEAAYAWSWLSEACHHHGYELGPTAGELMAMLETVERVLQRVRRADVSAFAPSA
jgi:hypothetical protein